MTNEDAYLVDNQLGLYVVADGMGGHSAGEVASKEAVETLHGMVAREQEVLDALEALPAESAAEGLELPQALQRTLRVMESAVQAATYMVFGLSEANPDRKGMGTTISAMVLRGRYAVTGQVGDSRIYLVREGAATQVTEDHTLVAWQVKKGLITEEEARHSRQKNVITRAVGSREYVQVDTRTLAVEPGDGFLLCSDGLHGYIAQDEIPALMQLGPEGATRRSIELANQRGGRDNITSVVVALT
ncbi:MAG: protein phosphatase 2C domain-containing protein [Myxococcales bacterium]|nr:protein phosphatase 2C domain-containing protein [Myxococcales bacterium]